MRFCHVKERKLEIDSGDCQLGISLASTRRPKCGRRPASSYQDLKVTPAQAGR